MFVFLPTIICSLQKKNFKKYGDDLQQGEIVFRTDYDDIYRLKRWRLHWQPAQREENAIKKISLTSSSFAEKMRDFVRFRKLTYKLTFEFKEFVFAAEE